MYQGYWYRFEVGTEGKISAISYTRKIKYLLGICFLYTDDDWICKKYIEN